MTDIITIPAAALEKGLLTYHCGKHRTSAEALEAAIAAALNAWPDMFIDRPELVPTRDCIILPLEKLE